VSFASGWITFIVITVFVIHRLIVDSQLRHQLASRDFKGNKTPSGATQYEERKKRDNNFLKKVYAVALVLIIWQGVWNPTQQHKADAKAAAAQYAAFISEYNLAWSDQCDAVFSRVANREVAIHGKSRDLTIEQCESLKSYHGAEISFNASVGHYLKDQYVFEVGNRGRSEGDSDALREIFALSPYWCWGNECETRETFG